MSKDIFETEKIQVTAFVGKKGNASVQISMKHYFEYEQLDSKQVRRLAKALLNRVNRVKGFRATD